MFSLKKIHKVLQGKKRRGVGCGWVCKFFGVAPTPLLDKILTSTAFPVQGEKEEKGFKFME